MPSGGSSASPSPTLSSALQVTSLGANGSPEWSGGLTLTPRGTGCCSGEGQITGLVLQLAQQLWAAPAPQGAPPGLSQSLKLLRVLPPHSMGSSSPCWASCTWDTGSNPSLCDHLGFPLPSWPEQSRGLSLSQPNSVSR